MTREMTTARSRIRSRDPLRFAVTESQRARDRQESPTEEKQTSTIDNERESTRDVTEEIERIPFRSIKHN